MNFKWETVDLTNIEGLLKDIVACEGASLGKIGVEASLFKDGTGVVGIYTKIQGGYDACIDELEDTFWTDPKVPVTMEELKKFAESAVRENLENKRKDYTLLLSVLQEVLMTE